MFIIVLEFLTALLQFCIIFQESIKEVERLHLCTYFLKNMYLIEHKWIFRILCFTQWWQRKLMGGSRLMMITWFRGKCKRPIEALSTMLVKSQTDSSDRDICPRGIFPNSGISEPMTHFKGQIGNTVFLSG